MHRLLLIALPVLLALALTATAKPVDSVSADFDGVLTTVGERQLNIKIEGELFWSAPNLRVDFKQNLTQEDMSALVDFDKQQATLLYHDTLNGQMFDLKEFSKADYFKRVRDLVSTNPGETPAGWTSSVVKDEEAKAAGQTHTKLTGPADEQVDLWRGNDDKPEKMLITTSKWTLTVNLSNVEYETAISADKFAYSSDYSVAKAEELPEGELPSL